MRVLQENGLLPVSEQAARRLAALGGALSEPIRVRMLALMAAGRSCCGLPELDGEDPGICVCEFEERFEMGQSKVSYHLGRLKNAGLVHEEKRGRWSYYSIRTAAVSELAGCLEELSRVPERREDGC